MKPIGACIFVVSFLMIFASLVRFYVFVMPPGGSKMSAVDVSIVPYQWLGWSPNYHEVLTPVQLLPRLQNDDHHHHHTQSATTRTTTPQTSLAMDQEEKKQGQSIRDQLKGHSFQTTNNRAHIVRQYESGSTASDRKTTRETPDRKGITFSLFRLEDLRQYFVRKLIIAVSVCILLAIILLCSIVSQLVRSSTRPSASQQVEIVQRILLSLCDDFAAATFDNSPYERIKYQGTFRSYEETKKPPPKAPKRVQIGGRYIYLIGRLRGGAGPTGTEQCVGQDQSGYDASNYENERTREQGDPEEINATITLPAIMRHYGRRNRQDAAASLAISVSTFKRKCREFGIERWPDVRRIRVKKPPDQHGEGNTSTARQTPSHHVQTGMGGEPVGENREANVLRQDFMGGPIALNIESGLIMVARPPYQHGEKNTSTACEVPSHNVETGMEIDPVGQNQEANVFRRDFTEGPTALNTENVSVSTLKRICRWFGIKRWPNIIRRKKAGRPPPDQYGEKNPSPTWKMLSTNGQTEMGNQMVGHLEETNEFLRDFVEGPHGGVSSEWAFEQNNQWTVSTSYPNSNGPEVPHPHIASTQILGENMESLGDRRNSFGSLEEHLLQGHNSGSMWTVPPCSDPVSSQHMPTITPTMGSSEDRINSLAFVEDVFLAEDDSGSIRWTIPTCFEPAPSQLMPTVPRTTGITDDLRNLLPSVEESFSAGHVSGFINRTVPSCSYPALSQPMSTVPHTTGSSDDLRNFLASVKEPIWAGHVSESINLTVPSCSDPPPSQSMPSILHTMPTNPRMMPLLIERQDTRSVNLKATYGDTTIKFQFPLTSGINELKEEVSKILECKLGSFNIEYKDEDGDWILMARDENVREYLQLLTSLGIQVTKLKVRDKVSDTTNF